MRFAELLNLPYDRDTGIIHMDAIKNVLPNTPCPVAQQVLADHGRKEEFQEQYAQLCLNTICWKNIEVTASTLIESSMHPDFRQWHESVKLRCKNFEQEGWGCIDTRANVVNHWQEHQTWLTSPVFLEGFVGKNSKKLHLVEGHTRLGILAGLIKNRILDANARHRIWLGSHRVSPRI